MASNAIPVAPSTPAPTQATLVAVRNVTARSCRSVFRKPDCSNSWFTDIASIPKTTAAPLAATALDDRNCDLLAVANGKDGDASADEDATIVAR
jgi:hypothetical protein